MKLVNSKYQINLEFEENRPQVLILENSFVMRDVVQQLWSQCNGGDGDFVLSDKKILKIDKNMELIVNPFSIDFQSRKIMTALYGKLADVANENVLEKNSINCEILNALDCITGKINYSRINYQIDFSWTDLFKFYGVKIELPENFLQRLVEYCKVLAEFCNVTVVGLVNVKRYLELKEIVELYKNAAYNKISLFLIETQETEIIESEQITIIDCDQCVIQKF